MIIYRITHKLSGKSYIGQTIRSLKYRWAQHCRSKRNYAINNAIRKYGKDAFIIEEIGRYNNLEDLNNAEEYYIDWFNCLAPNGYNLDFGGTNKMLTKETRLKISNANKGSKNGFFGKTHSDETKRKWKETRIGTNHPRFGKKHTEETKLKISLTKRGLSNG